MSGMIEVHEREVLSLSPQTPQLILSPRLQVHLKWTNMKHQWQVNMEIQFLQSVLERKL